MLSELVGVGPFCYHVLFRKMGGGTSTELILFSHARDRL